jgi:hypothetical protein
MHLDTVPLIRAVALLHTAEIRGLESPITIRNGTADDDGVRHGGQLLTFPRLILNLEVESVCPSGCKVRVFIDD